jgi:DNA gyrase subunit B
MSEEPESRYDDRIGPGGIVPLVAVRYRPGMYIGGTDMRAFHYMLEQLLDCLLEDYFGHCAGIEVTLKPDHIITISAQNDGFPIENHEKFGISKLQLFLERGRLLQGSSFLEPFHGSDLAVANALSEWMLVEVARDGYLWQQRCETGIPLAPVTSVRPLENGEPTGITVTFRPDFTIFQQHEFRYPHIARRCLELAYLHAGLPIILRDEREENRQERFYTERGLYDLVEQMRSPESVPLHDILHTLKSVAVYDNNTPPHFSLEFVFQFVDHTMYQDVGFANSIHTFDGGRHMDAFHRGIERTLNKNRPRAESLFQWQDITAQINAAISIWHPSPQLESLTKVRLINPDVFEPIARIVTETFDAFATSHPDQMQHIIDHCIANRARRQSTRP